jgi:hypothetical protein
MDVAKAKQVVADENARRFLHALREPTSVDMVIYSARGVDGEPLRQTIMLNPDGTWRIHP